MEYTGKLYGKYRGAYFDTGKTSADWDALEAEIQSLRTENERLREGQSEQLKAFCLHGGIQMLVPTKAKDLDELIKDYVESL